MQAAVLWGRHIHPPFRWGIAYFSIPVLHTAPTPSPPRPRVLPLDGTQGSLMDSDLAQAFPCEATDFVPTLPHPAHLGWMAPLPAPAAPTPTSHLWHSGFSGFSEYTSEIPSWEI